MDVASFLLTCTSTLPDAEKISEQLLGGGNDDDEEDENMEDAEKKIDKNDTTAIEDTKPAAASSDPQATLLQSIQASQQHPTFATTNNEIIEVSCINPRGKFQLSIYKSGIILTNPKKPEEVIPISNNVSNVVWFRKPEDYKKMKQLAKNGGGGSGGKGKDKGIPGHMILICLEDGTMFRNKPLKQVCFQLPTYPSQSTAEGSDNSTQLNEKSWWDGLSSSLFTEDNAKKSDIIRVNASMETGKSSNGFVFKSAGEQGSSSTTEGLPFVGCYQGFNDGALFPLKEGLLFFKPPRFVPRSELASISCGRGAGGSRYVDMEVKLDVSDDDDQEGKKKKQSDTLEWSNINRDELEGLNNYIHKTLIPAMQMDADGTNEEASDGNSSNDDDDFAVAEVVNTSDDDSEESSRKRRPSRAASKQAREINKAALAGGNDEEDSDEDSDEFEEEEDSDDSSDEESVVSDKSDGAGSSSEDEDEEEANDSDGSDYRESKKARVE